MNAIDLMAWNFGAGLASLSWIVVSLIWLAVLNYRQERFEERCQKLKNLQDKTNEAIQEFLSQVNKDIDNLQDRVAEIEKEKEG